jgi:PAS domain S-box
VKDHTLRRVYVFFLAIFGVLAAVAVYAVSAINRAQSSSDWVNQTHEVIAEVNSVLSTVRAGEGALRSYVLTGDRRDLAAAREAFATMTEHVEIAKALTRSDSGANAQVSRLEELVNQRSELAERVAAARDAGEMEQVRAMLAEDAGVDAIGEIRRGVERLREEQMALLAARDRESYLQAQKTRWIVGSGVAMNFVLFAAVSWLIRDDLAARRRAAAVLREANEQLDAKVRERTGELAATNERLTAENLERRWANQALEHQLRYNQLIVDSVYDLVFVLTKALNVTRINPAVVHLTGWEAKDLLGGPLQKVLQLEKNEAELDLSPIGPIAQALRDGRELRDRAALIADRRGRRVAARCALFPLRDRDKVVGGILIVHAASVSQEARS